MPTRRKNGKFEIFSPGVRTDVPHPTTGLPPMLAAWANHKTMGPQYLSLKGERAGCGSACHDSGRSHMRN